MQIRMWLITQGNLWNIQVIVTLWSLNLLVIEDKIYCFLNAHSAVQLLSIFPHSTKSVSVLVKHLKSKIREKYKTEALRRNHRNRTS